jgi:hypothetical protein
MLRLLYFCIGIQVVRQVYVKKNWNEMEEKGGEKENNMH